MRQHNLPSVACERFIKIGLMKYPQVAFNLGKVLAYLVSCYGH